MKLLLYRFYHELSGGHNGKCHKTVKLKWSRKCKFGCGYVHLNTSSADFRKKCCLGGEARKNKHIMPDLPPLEGVFKRAIYKNYEKFNLECTTVNNILAMGKIGVSGSWEKGVGNRCVKMNGRTYHLTKGVTSNPGRKLFRKVGFGFLHDIFLKLFFCFTLYRWIKSFRV
jgi:hypothetical protein